MGFSIMERESISTNREIPGNRRLPLNPAANTVYTEDAEVYSNEFPMICHSFQMEESGFVFVPHRHKLFEILYVEKGFPRFVCNGVTIEAQAGDMMIFNSDDIHACFYADAPYKSRTMQFDLSLLISDYEHVYEYNFLNAVRQKQILFDNHIKKADSLYNLFCAIEREYYANEKGFETAIKGLLYQTVTNLYRKHSIVKNAAHSDKKNTIANKLNYERYEYATEYIQAHYTEDLTPDIVAKELFIDNTYLRKIWKQFGGTTFNRYLHSVRIMQATRLLCDTQKTIGLIATEVGYNDINYFSRMFREIIGVSPTDLRNQRK